MIIDLTSELLDSRLVCQLVLNLIIVIIKLVVWWLYLNLLSDFKKINSFIL